MTPRRGEGGTGTTPVLEAVPNFSEGRDPAFLRDVAEAMEGAGVEILDASADADHHRSVVTMVGPPRAVEAALVRGAEVAIERIDLRAHRGVHPRIGALDVAPVVPLLGMPMSEAVASARRVAAGIEALGVPAYLYGSASPSGRGLAFLRKGGFEALVGGFPPDRRPEFASGRRAAHPTAGAVCVGARELLLAWNLQIEGVPPEDLKMIARDLRESGGGFPGLRALALELPGRRVSQLSMNLEDVDRRDPAEVFEAAEERVHALGGRIAATEVVGMIPDALVFRTSARRLGLLGADPTRLLSARLARHVAQRPADDVETLVSWVQVADCEIPLHIRAAAERLAPSSTATPIPGESA